MDELGMKTYIGVKMLGATPMTLGDYNAYREWIIPENEDPSKAGYLVKYGDGYESWSPKEVFESQYFELAGDQTKAGQTITPDDVDRFMKLSTATQVSPKAATIQTETVTGFDLYETTACVDPVNYDENLALDIGSKRNENKLWGHLGFVLQWAVFGIKQ